MYISDSSAPQNIKQNSYLSGPHPYLKLWEMMFIHDNVLEMKLPVNCYSEISQ